MPEEFWDTVLKHGRAGPTAPDGVAGDSACQDLGLRLGGSDRQECYAGLGRAGQLAAVGRPVASHVLSLHTLNGEERDDCLHILLKVL